MSTRALYTFADESGEFHVYKHHDGYPDDGEGNGGLHWIARALPYAWPLPRFEADEFAAAFVAANKGSYGGIRLMPSGDWKDVAPGDIEYRYRVTCTAGKLTIEVWSVYERNGEWVTSKIKV